jgi:hypothetical protein
MWMCADIGYKNKLPKFKIGLVYIGSKEAFKSIVIEAKDLKTAFNLAAGYLKPNHMQTLMHVVV